MNVANPVQLSILKIANLITNTSIIKFNSKFLKVLDDDPFRIKPSI